jgi:arginyl-tRNA synthetase
MNTAATSHPIVRILEERIGLSFAIHAPNAAIMLAPASKAEFGDYQVNGVMAAAKQLKVNPRVLAERIVADLSIDDFAEKIDIAGPGFINIHIKNKSLAQAIEHMAVDHRLGVPRLPEQTVVIDYSSPNLAKEMHVGHLRSTIIGDALTRTLMYLGQRVIPQNHVGDWGTQFGMLTAYLLEQQHHASDVQDLEAFYRAAKIRFDEDPAFADRSRTTVVRLQSGDPEILALWQQFVHTSLQHCQEIYDRLGVLLKKEHVCAESFYNHDLPVVVQSLRDQGILQEDEGAQCVFLDEEPQHDSPPFIVQKKDGGYLYTTTDLAAIRYRVHTLQAQRILYVVDARQSMHFQQLFAVAAKTDWATSCSLEHVAFGTMMGADGKPFKTRSGDTVKLSELLKEAFERALTLLHSKSSDMSSEEQQHVAHIVSMGAIKYADLSKNRTSDYAFDWDHMLSFDGNTAPYLQYAYARICKILDKHPAPIPASIIIDHPMERALALALLQFGDEVVGVARHLSPHHLCLYLYQLASHFSRFYEQCPILKADNDDCHKSRLALAQLTAQVLKKGLDLLGIEVLRSM